MIGLPPPHRRPSRPPAALDLRDPIPPTTTSCRTDSSSNPSCINLVSKPRSERSLDPIRPRRSSSSSLPPPPRRRDPSGIFFGKFREQYRKILFTVLFNGTVPRRRRPPPPARVPARRPCARSAHTPRAPLCARPLAGVTAAAVLQFPLRLVPRRRRCLVHRPPVQRQADPAGRRLRPRPACPPVLPARRRSAAPIRRRRRLPQTLDRVWAVAESVDWRNSRG